MVAPQGRYPVGRLRGKVTFSIRSAGNDLVEVPTVVHHSPSNPLDTLLRAAEQLREDDELRFLFVGGGIGKKRVEEFVAQRDGVLFLGVNEGDLADNTGSYDIVIEAEASGR